MIKIRLAVLLAERGLKIRDIHSRTGIPMATLRNLYYGRSNSVKIKDLEAICKVLNCCVGDILDYQAR
ncbi:helix-turn-helix transcriptional regulator [Lysinibacillus sp. FSL K6-0075]|uniref:helix-turn-helix domain-containing protein n=1 Tax=Lysinibacillus sp. FSL K6-0075 TaxID=2921415 RepID=UPI0031594AD7